jgi:putative ABC transport system permease protein
MAYNVNILLMRFLERLFARAVGDPGIADAIIGDLEEERLPWHAVHLLALTLRFAVRRRPTGAAIPVSRSSPMSTILQDLRYAARVLLRQPGFSLVVILTLAIGLGANGAVFAMVDALLVRPLPSADLADMVQVFEANAAQREDRDGVSPPNYFDWKRQATSFAVLVAFEWWDANLSDPAEDPEQVVGRKVSAAFFDALRVRIARGRSFVPQEETTGAHRVVVISHRLWQRRWAGSPSLVGSTITVDREPHVVVGITPEGFDYPTGAEIWAPITFTEANLTERSRRYLEVIGRLKPHVTIEAARREMETIAARLAREHPEANSGYSVNVMPLSFAMLDLGMPQVLAIWQLAVVLVLLIAGANVANLLMVRGTARQRELALRLAIGASRWRVVRQLVVESVLLALVGVTLAVPIAAGGIRLLKGFMPPEIARWVLGWNEIDIDGRLLGATMIAGVVAGAVFGVLPALRASRPELSSSLKEGGRGAAGRGRALQGFVVAQVALALALLVSAGLSTRGAVRLLTQYDGYDPQGVMTFAFTLPENAYPDDGARRRFFERTLERVSALPLVEVAAFSSSIPFASGSGRRPVEVEGRPVASASERPEVDFRAITPDYLRVLRVSITRGRGFTRADGDQAPPVGIIDELMAERLWPGEDPIGRRFRPTLVADAPWITVVGIAGNVKHDWFSGYRPTYYAPYAQVPRSFGVLAVRTRGDETAITPAVRQVFNEIDPDLPLADVHSLLRHRSLKTIGMQFVAGLMATFAGIGLFLSAIGIYGVMAYSVNQRTREIGVRMALGATAREVLGMTLRDAMSLAGVGIVVGLVIAFALGKLLAANLFGVVQLDTVTFVVVAAVLASVAFAAGSVPARRAMRVDPVTALRAE